MTPTEVDICFFHGNCHDGALAAAILKQKAKPSCEFLPVWWDSLPSKPSIDGKSIVFLDLTPCSTVLTEVLARSRGVYIIDHHESARATLLAQLTNDMFRYDSRECGSTLTWRWVYGDSAPYPLLLKYVKALDIFDWSDLLTEEPAAMSLSRCIEQIVSPTVAEMEDALRRGSAFFDTIRANAYIVDMVIERQIDRCLGSIEYYCLRHADKVRVAVVNTQHFINYIAYRVYNCTNVHVVWLWYRHGSSHKIRVMLRSNGRFDCQHYAAMYGGGGHPNAATFLCEREMNMWDHMWI